MLAEPILRVSLQVGALRDRLGCLDPDSAEAGVVRRAVWRTRRLLGKFRSRETLRRAGPRSRASPWAMPTRLEGTADRMLWPQSVATHFSRKCMTTAVGRRRARRKCFWPSGPALQHRSVWTAGASKYPVSGTSSGPWSGNAFWRPRARTRFHRHSSVACPRLVSAYCTLQWCGGCKAWSGCGDP